MNQKVYPKDHPEYILFYGEKNAENEWYTVNEDKGKIWDTKKVTEFWTTLRAEKMAKEDYDFSHFIFPEFGTENFWVKGVKKMYNKKVNFNHASFGGEASFWNTSFGNRASFWMASFSDKANFGASFGGEANFEDASFVGEANFEDASFVGEANFRKASFGDKANFLDAFFGGQANFGRASFGGQANFGRASFGGEANFGKASFVGEANFWESSFVGKANFWKTSFVSEANFWKISFVGEANFWETSYKSELFFEDVYCIDNASLIFNNTKFTKEYPTHFKNIHFIPTKEGDPVVIFYRISFDEQVIFLNCDLTYMQFIDCELTQATIGNCDFPRKERRKFLGISVSSNRIQMGNEEFINSMLEQLKQFNAEEKEAIENAIDKLNENRDDEQKIKPEPPLVKKNGKVLKLEYYKMMAVTYRQLKTNRANNKDWATAGDAYRSEMIMRRKIVWYEIINNGKIIMVFNWLIIWAHDIFSGFQQSLSRPLLWLVMVWFGFGVGYFYHNGGVIGCGLQKSMYAMLLLSGGLDTDSPLYGYMVLERVLGVILITFFVLATRARLKQ